MKKNVGSADQIIRYVLAAILIILYFLKVVPPVWGYIFLGLAAVFIITSLLNFCPIWWIIGVKTNKTKS
jgi:hypothetical protein